MYIKRNGRTLVVFPRATRVCFTLHRRGGISLGNGSEGVSLLWGAANRHVARHYRRARAIGLYIGEDF